MPDLNKIEEFKFLLNTLGDEPAILAEKGRTIEDVTPEDSGMADDLSRLFSSADEEAGIPPDFPEEIGETDVAEDDFGAEVLPDESSARDEFLSALDEINYDEDEADSASPEDTFALPDEASSLPEDNFFSTDELGEPEGFEEPEGPNEPENLTEPEDFGEPKSPGEAEDLEELGDLTESEDFGEFGDLGEPEDFGGAEELEEPEDFEEAENLGEPEDLGDPEEMASLPDDEFSFDDTDALSKLAAEEEDFGFSDFGIPEDDLSPEEGEEPGDLEEPGENIEFDDDFSVSEMEEPEPVDVSAESEAEDFGFGDFAAPGTDEDAHDEISMGEELSDTGGEDFLESVDDEAELSGDFDISDFNLGDLGDQFGLDSAEATASGMGPIPSFSADQAMDAGMEEVSTAGDELFSLSDDEFKRLQTTLETLPRNLKIIVEEQIGEKGLAGDSLQSVINALVGGSSPKQIAALLSRITGQRIEIPAQYEKISGLSFEEEKGSFAYAFRHNILPILKVFLLGAAVLGLVLFLGYRYVYTPIYADHLYRSGVKEIQAEKYEAGNEFFRRASEKLRLKKWYFTYAEEFSAEKQYPLAEEKYDELLRYYPGDPKGLLDYARLESEVLGKYPQAEALLKQRLLDDAYDPDALLLAGDNYMRWGDELDPAKYEEARYHYALLIQQYGQKDLYLFRMLRYVIRVDNYPEVVRLKNAFQANPRAKIEPVIYADLAGYLMDKNDFTDVSAILERARQTDPNLPEVYFQFGRYFRQINDNFREETAVKTTLDLLQGQNPASRTRLRILILSHNRMGEILYGKGAFLEAENQYQRAGERYEEAVSARRVSPAKEYGKIYANLGDLYYYIVGDYETALTQYETGQKNLYSTPDIVYKKGFIYYRRRDFQRALVQFYNAAEGYSDNPNLLYSTAAVLYLRNNYFSAQGYYNHLIDILEQKRSNIPYLLIEEKADHRALVENLMMSYNNLGVTLNRLYLATGDPEKNSLSLVNFTRSSEYFDYLTRDQETLVRTETRNLSYLNTRDLLYPVPGYEPQIYRTLPRDMKELGFR